MGIITFLLLLVLISAGVNLINPRLVSSFIDTAVETGPIYTMINSAILFLVLSVIGQLVTILSTYISKKVAWKTTNSLREDLMRHCFHLGPGFNNTKTPGEMIERIDGDVTFLSNFFSNFVVILISNFILILGILVSLSLVSWIIGLSFVIFSVFMFILIRRINTYSVPYWVKNRDNNATLYGYIEERLYGAEAIKTNGAMKYMFNTLERLMISKLLSERMAFMISSTTWGSTVIMFALGSAGAMGLGAYLYLHNNITIGTVFLIYSYVQMLRTPIEGISNQFQDIQKASASIMRINEVLGNNNLMIDGTQEVLFQDSLRVEFENVTFGYEKDQIVVNNMSFDLPAGESMGVVGKTGSGKTSLVRLVYRFYDCNSGLIKINGQDIRQYKLNTIRDQIALVTQDIQLFHGTLRDNITFFNKDISDSEIENGFIELGLGEWYRALPKGLNTMLKSNEVSISEGEAQLIALTRMFLKDPKLIILDEATANLDPITENLIVTAIKKITKNRTLIIIAHRLHTLRSVDNILVLEDGKNLEFGRRENLEQRMESQYWNLINNKKGELLA